MRYLKITLICLLLSSMVLAAQSFGFGYFNTIPNTGLSGITFDIPTKGSWNPQILFSLESVQTSSFSLGLKLSRDMGTVYNIKRYLGAGMGVWQDWSGNIRYGGQAQVGIKVPTFVEGFRFGLEVGFGLNSGTKTGKLNGGAFVGFGSSYSF